MSDRELVLSTLRAADSILFVEPGRELYTQDEVHKRARAIMNERGLPLTSPYAGWHSQADAFDRTGALVGPQRIYFGGDREIVRSTLGVLESIESSSFVVLGGRSDGEAFAVLRNASPTRVSADQHDAWAIRLAVLGSAFAAPLRPSEDELLHELLAEETALPLHASIVRALRLRGLLTEPDFDHAFSTATAANLERMREPGETATELSHLVVAAFGAGYPEAAQIVENLAQEGRADVPMFAAWGGPAARDAAFNYALTSPAGPAIYLDLVGSISGDVVMAGVGLAEQLRLQGGPNAAKPIVGPLVASYGGATKTYALQALRDNRVPAWLRVLIADEYSKAPTTREEVEADWARFQRGLATEVAEQWPAIVDAVRLEAGLEPSPGFDLYSTVAHSAVIEQREYMLDTHLEGLRAAIRRSDLDEPTVAILLELLVPAGALEASDLDVVAGRWKELFVKPNGYVPAPPALLSLVLACVRVGHPLGGTILAAVRKDKRKWAEPLRLALIGALSEGAEADREAESLLRPLAFSGADTSDAARFALGAVRARELDISPVAAACDLILQSPERPGYIGRGFAMAAIAFMEAGSAGLWQHRFRTDSTRSLGAALALVADEQLPFEARRRIFAVASESKVLAYPERAAVLPHPRVTGQLSDQLKMLGETFA